MNDILKIGSVLGIATVFSVVGGYLFMNQTSGVPQSSYVTGDINTKVVGLEAVGTEPVGKAVLTGETSSFVSDTVDAESPVGGSVIDATPSTLVLVK